MPSITIIKNTSVKTNACAIRHEIMIKTLSYVIITDITGVSEKGREGGRRGSNARESILRPAWLLCANTRSVNKIMASLFSSTMCDKKIERINVNNNKFKIAHTYLHLALGYAILIKVLLELLKIIFKPLC